MEDVVGQGGGDHRQLAFVMRVWMIVHVVDMVDMVGASVASLQDERRDHGELNDKLRARGIEYHSLPEQWRCARPERGSFFKNYILFILFSNHILFFIRPSNVIKADEI
jgi:hypothetical protein